MGIKICKLVFDVFDGYKNQPSPFEFLDLNFTLRCCLLCQISSKLEKSLQILLTGWIQSGWLKDLAVDKPTLPIQTLDLCLALNS